MAMPEFWSGYNLTSKQARMRQVYAGLGPCPECDALAGNPCRERLLSGRRQALFAPHVVRREAVAEDA